MRARRPRSIPALKPIALRATTSINPLILWSWRGHTNTGGLSIYSTSGERNTRNVRNALEW